MTEEGEAMSTDEPKSINNTVSQWMAVYTRPRWEKKVARLFEQRGITFYCPLIRVERQWSDRRKVILEPVIRSYVFVRITEAERIRVLQTDGVLRLLQYLGKPAVIRDAEMDVLMRFFKEGSSAQNPSESLDRSIRKLDRVMITEGVLSGEQGVFWAWKGNRAIIRLSRLNWELDVLFDRTAIARL